MKLKTAHIAGMIGLALVPFALSSPAQAAPAVDQNNGSWSDTFADNAGIANVPTTYNIKHDPFGQLVTLAPDKSNGQLTTTLITPVSFETWGKVYLDYTATQPSDMSVGFMDEAGNITPLGAIQPSDDTAWKGMVSLAGIPNTKAAGRLVIGFTERVVVQGQPDTVPPTDGDPADIRIKPTLQAVRATWTPRSVVKVSLETPTGACSNQQFAVKVRVAVSFVNAKDLTVYAPLTPPAADQFGRTYPLSFGGATNNGFYQSSATTINGLAIPANSIVWRLGDVNAGNTFVLTYTVSSPVGTLNGLTYTHQAFSGALNASPSQTSSLTTVSSASPSPWIQKSSSGTFLINNRFYINGGQTLTYNLYGGNWYIPPQTCTEAYHKTVIIDDVSRLVSGTGGIGSVYDAAGFNISNGGTFTATAKTVDGVAVPANSIYWQLGSLEVGSRFNLSYSLKLKNDTAHAGPLPLDYEIINYAAIKSGFQTPSAQTEAHVFIGIPNTPNGQYAKGDKIRGSAGISAGNNDNWWLSVGYGDPITFLLYARNGGASSLDDTWLVDKVPAGTTFASAFLPQGTGTIYYNADGAANPESSPPNFDVTNGSFTAGHHWTSTLPADTASIKWVAFKVNKLASSYFPDGTNPNSVVGEVTVTVNQPTNGCPLATITNLGLFQSYAYTGVGETTKTVRTGINGFAAQDYEPVQVKPVVPSFEYMNVYASSTAMISTGDVTFTVNVPNSQSGGVETDTALNAQITMAMPSLAINGVQTYLPFVSIDAQGGNVDFSGLPSTLKVSYGSIAPQASKSIAVRVTVPRGYVSGSSFGLSAQATASDDVCGGISAGAGRSVSITGEPYLQLFKKNDLGVAAQGSNITYTMQFTNVGDAVSTKTWIIDRVPTGTHFSWATGTPNGGEVWFSTKAPPQLPASLRDTSFTFRDAVVRNNFTKGSLSGGRWYSNSGEPVWVAWLVDDSRLSPSQFPVSGLASVQWVANVDANVAAGSVIRNLGAVLSNENDQAASNEVQTVVSNDPSLEVRRTCPDVASAGETVRYSIDYVNNSTNDDYGVQLVETLPSLLTLAGSTHTFNDAALSAFGPIDVPPSLKDGSYVFDISHAIDAGGTVPLSSFMGGTVAVDVTIKPGTASGSFADVGGLALATDSTGALGLSIFTGCRILVENADLFVRMGVDQMAPVAGETITYTVITSNEGANDADDVSIVVTLPPNVTIKPGTAFMTTSGWTMMGQPFVGTDGQGRQTLTWSVAKGNAVKKNGDVAGHFPGRSGDVTITLQAVLASTIPPETTLPASVVVATTSGEDPNKPNTASVTVRTPQPDPYIVKSGATFAQPGASVTYRFRYGNDSRQAAGPTFIVDKLYDAPVGDGVVDVTYVGSTAGNGETVYFNSASLTSAQPAFDPANPGATGWRTTPGTTAVNWVGVYRSSLPGSSGPFSVYLDVALRTPSTGLTPLPGATIANTATIALVGPNPPRDEDPTNNTSTVETKTPGIDIAIATTCDPTGAFPGVIPGQEVAVTLELKNNGTVPAYGLKIGWVAPSWFVKTTDDATTISVLGAQGGAATPIDQVGAPINDAVNWTATAAGYVVGSTDASSPRYYRKVGIPAGAKVQIVVHGTVAANVANDTAVTQDATAITDYRFDFNAQTDETEKILTNNADSCGTKVYRADPLVIKTGAGERKSPPFTAGDRVRFTIEYQNAGMAPADEVSIEDYFPSETPYVVGSFENIPSGAHLEFADENGFGYEPVGDPGRVDPHVKGFRIVWDGQLPAPAGATFAQDTKADFEKGTFKNTVVIGTKNAVGIGGESSSISGTYTSPLIPAAGQGHVVSWGRIVVHATVAAQDAAPGDTEPFTVTVLDGETNAVIADGLVPDESGAVDLDISPVDHPSIKLRANMVGGAFRCDYRQDTLLPYDTAIPQYPYADIAYCLGDGKAVLYGEETVDGIYRSFPLVAAPTGTGEYEITRIPEDPNYPESYVDGLGRNGRWLGEASIGRTNRNDWVAALWEPKDGTWQFQPLPISDRYTTDNSTRFSYYAWIDDPTSGDILGRWYDDVVGNTPAVWTEGEAGWEVHELLGPPRTDYGNRINCDGRSIHNGIVAGQCYTPETNSRAWIWVEQADGTWTPTKLTDADGTTWSTAYWVTDRHTIIGYANLNYPPYQRVLEWSLVDGSWQPTSLPLPTEDSQFSLNRVSDDEIIYGNYYRPEFGWTVGIYRYVDGAWQMEIVSPPTSTNYQYYAYDNSPVKDMVFGYQNSAESQGYWRATVSRRIDGSWVTVTLPFPPEAEGLQGHSYAYFGYSPEHVVGRVDINNGLSQTYLWDLDWTTTPPTVLGMRAFESKNESIFSYYNSNVWYPNSEYLGSRYADYPKCDLVYFGRSGNSAAFWDATSDVDPVPQLTVTNRGEPTFRGYVQVEVNGGFLGSTYQNNGPQVATAWREGDVGLTPYLLGVPEEDNVTRVNWMQPATASYDMSAIIGTSYQYGTNAYGMNWHYDMIGWSWNEETNSYDAHSLPLPEGYYHAEAYVNYEYWQQNPAPASAMSYVWGGNVNRNFSWFWAPSQPEKWINATLAFERAGYKTDLWPMAGDVDYSVFRAYGETTFPVAIMQDAVAEQGYKIVDMPIGKSSNFYINAGRAMHLLYGWVQDPETGGNVGAYWLRNQNDEFELHTLSTTTVASTIDAGADVPFGDTGFPLLYGGAQVTKESPWQQVIFVPDANGNYTVADLKPPEGYTGFSLYSGSWQGVDQMFVYNGLGQGLVGGTAFAEDKPSVPVLQVYQGDKWIPVVLPSTDTVADWQRRVEYSVTGDILFGYEVHPGDQNDTMVAWTFKDGDLSQPVVHNLTETYGAPVAAAWPYLGSMPNGDTGSVSWGWGDRVDDNGTSYYGDVVYFVPDGEDIRVVASPRSNNFGRVWISPTTPYINLRYGDRPTLWGCSKGGGVELDDWSVLYRTDVNPSFSYSLEVPNVCRTSITNTATVLSSSPQVTSSNDQSTASLPVETSDVKVTIRADRGVAVIGDNIGYRVTVSNAGPGPAREVLVDTRLPSGDGQSAGARRVERVAVLEAGGTRTYDYSVTVTTNESFVSLVANTQVTTTSIDCNSTNDASSATTLTGNLPNLAITAEGPDSAQPTEAFTWTFTTVNDGKAPASNPVITIPVGGLTVQSFSVTYGGSDEDCVLASDAIVCTPDDLWPLEQEGSPFIVEVTLVAGACDAIGGTASTTAEAASELDTNIADNTATIATKVVEPSGHLALSITSSRSAVEVGKPVTWTVHFQNNGAEVVRDIAIRSTASAGFTISSASETEGAVVNGSTVSLAVGALAPGESGALVYSGVATGAANTRVSATATAEGAGACPAAASPATSVLVQGGDLTIVKQASVGVSCGDAIDWVVTVSNRGATARSGLVVTDRIPAGTAYVSGSIAGVGANATGAPVLVWNVGTLAAGQAVTLGYRTQAPAASGALVSNVAKIEVDGAVVAQTAESLVRATCNGAAVVLTKSWTPSTPAPNGTMTVSLLAVNKGTTPQATMLVEDWLEPGLTWVGSTSGATYDAATRVVSQTFTDVAPGARRAVDFKVTVGAEAGGKIYTNSGTVTTGEIPPQTSNVVTAVVVDCNDRDVCTADANVLFVGCTHTLTPIEGVADGDCDGVDDDCDGKTDEDYVVQETSCGLGVCERAGTIVCEPGAHAPKTICTPGISLVTTDTTCDFLDEDCDGKTDEEYASRGVVCGDFCDGVAPTSCVEGDEVWECKPLDLGATCDDGNACSDASTCDGRGTCVARRYISCNDDNACTADTCAPDKGCVFAAVADGQPCDDSNECTFEDLCTSGQCGGTAKTCDKPDECHFPGECNPATGVCDYEVRPGDVPVPIAITDLGTLGGNDSEALAVNAQGDVVGQAETEGGELHAFLWTAADGMTDLTAGTAGASRALGVNDGGLVVGVRTAGSTTSVFGWTKAGGVKALFEARAGVADDALVYGPTAGGKVAGNGANGAAYYSANGATATAITIEGGSDVTVRGLDDAGIVAGQVTIGGAKRAFTWTAAGGAVTVATGDESDAVDVNGDADAAGVVTSGGKRHAYVFHANGTSTDLGTLGGDESWATAINADGVVVGVSELASGDLHAFRHTPGDASLKDLGAIGAESAALFLSDSTYVAGTSVNAGGGTQAVVWSPSATLMAVDALGAPMVSVAALNESGAIAGALETVGGSRAYRWDAGRGTEDLGTFGGAAAAARDINGAGVVVGEAETATGAMHAFVSKAPATACIVCDVDDQPPTIVCPVFHKPVECSPDGNAVELGKPSVSDACGLPVTVTNDAPATFPAGTTVVTFTATDSVGNQASCTTTVVVTDRKAPILDCAPTLTVQAAEGVCGASVQLNATAHDDCMGSVVTILGPNGDIENPVTFGPGETDAVITAVDSSGNRSTCTTKVTVEGVEGLDILCDPELVVEAPADFCGYPEALSADVHDVCAVDATVQTASDSFPLGVTDVTFEASNDRGESDTCVTKLTVKDVTKPVVDCGIPVDLQAPPVVFAPTATDACGVEVTVADAGCFKVEGETATQVTDGCEVVVRDGRTIAVSSVPIYDAAGAVISNEALRVQWSVHAVDPSGNASDTQCSAALDLSGRDRDRDGIPDVADNCPDTKNPDQLDTDLDHIGDACDTAPFDAMTAEGSGGCAGGGSEAGLAAALAVAALALARRRAVR